jgi:hypothetical protein
MASAIWKQSIQPERYLPGGTAEWVLKHFVTGKIIHGDIYPMTTQEIRQKIFYKSLINVS